MSYRSEKEGKPVEGHGVCAPPADKSRRRNFARWRALSLSLVYLAFAAHIVHWKLTGKTLAPLELNEVMYTLELGIVTAGFLFMCFLVLGTLIFGRFFCSWACHIMVLQDLCAYILRKMRIRAKPIRSRLLLAVPPLTAFYMFIWPQIVRTWHDGAFPAFHLATDRDGWASLVTNNFWRNLPGPWVIALTLVVCGFLIVYLLGSRTFCTYVCPYGAVFSLADRFSPGRIRVTDACRQCGTCTATCTSGVRVHEEVKRHGMIVNPACLKDFDCIGACPENALHYTFTKPALFKSFKSGGRFGLPYNFSIAEELLIGLVFVVVLLSFRGLYSKVPFLLSLALGAIIGCLSVFAVRLVRRPSVTLSTLHLKQQGRLTFGGRAFSGVIVLLAGFVIHSAFVRYHEYSGLKQAIVMGQATGAADRDGPAARAFSHLVTADRWGLVANERVERSLARVALHLERFEVSRSYASRYLKRHARDTQVLLYLGQAFAGLDRMAEAERCFRAIIAASGAEGRPAPPGMASAHQGLAGILAARGEFAEAADELRRALILDPNRSAAHAERGSALAELGRLDDAVASLREAVRLDPNLGRAHYNLGTILAFAGQLEQAIPCYERALATMSTDSDLLNNLGFALMRTGKLEQSRVHLERAVAGDPDNADAHFNLATLHASQQRLDEATEHLRIAARLDPRYARLLSHE